MVITIDRVEKDTLVIELADGQMIDVPRALIPDASGRAGSNNIEKK